MNSLPFISHHLFVAAIGNEGRPHERHTRPLKPLGSAAAPASPVAVEAVDSRKALLDGEGRPLRTSLARVRG
jgi:hypothetical protein